MKLVEAVRTPVEVELVERKLRLSGSGLCADLWRIGVNFALRISDLLSLRYDDVCGRSFIINEGKTGKSREIVINDKARTVIERRRRQHPEHIYLFQGTGNRTKSQMAKPVNRTYVTRQFTAVGEELGLKLGTHSMRKTRGYVMFEAGIRIEVISKLLNHSSTRETLRYIGIEKSDIDQTYIDFQI